MLKSNNKKLRGFLLVLLAILMSIVAQIVLLMSADNDWSLYFTASRWITHIWDNTTPTLGVMLYALAGVFFIVGLRDLKDSLSPVPLYTEKRSSGEPPKLGFWMTSLALSGVVSAYAFSMDGDTAYGYLFSAIWILSIVLLTISVLVQIDWRPPAASSVLNWFKTHYPELIVLSAILAGAFLVRFLDVELHPYSFINDEGMMGENGACFLTGECTHFFSLGWAAQSRLAFFAYSISVALLGRTALAIRLISVITGTLSILAVYLFAREIFDKKIAWISAILLGNLPVHIHFSRIGVDNIIDSLTAPLVLWLLIRGAKRDSTLSFLAAGIIAGFCIYTYPGSLLVPALGVGLLGWLALSQRGFLQAHLRNIAIFVLAGAIVAIPLLGHYALYPDYFLARMHTEGLLSDNKIETQAHNSGITPTEFLATQFAKSSLVFIATGAPSNFFNSPRAYLPGAAAIIFMLGMGYILWRIKDLRYLSVFVWFWAVVIMGSALTGGPPTSQRILMSMPALAIIMAIGLTKILWAFRQVFQPFGRVTPVLILAVVLYISYTNLSFYFYDYRLGHYFEDPTNELTFETRRVITPLHDKGRMYLIAYPNEPYLSFASFNYFSPDVEKSTLNDTSKESLDSLPRDKDILFIALPAFKTDLEAIAGWAPGGEWQEFTRRYRPGEMLFYSYKLTKEQLAAITTP